MPRLGFGCASLGSRIGVRESMELLSGAFDLGIRHFDVAPSYGRGLAEGIVGRFLDGRRDRVTVCTKFGIVPVPRRVYTSMLLATGRLARRVAPRFGRSVSAQAPAQRLDRVSPAILRQSVEFSLAALGTDHIDTLLFHECSAEAALCQDLRAELDNLMAAGKLRRVGVATDGTTTIEIISDDRSATYSVVQCANSVFEPALEQAAGGFAPADLVITHSAFGNGDGLERMRRALARAPARARALSDLGVCLDTREAIAQALLRYALATNPDGLVIISTTSRERLEQNCEVAAQPVDMPPAIRRLLIDLAVSGEHDGH